jgi:hypothetical protein
MFTIETDSSGLAPFLWQTKKQPRDIFGWCPLWSSLFTQTHTHTYIMCVYIYIYIYINLCAHTYSYLYIII